MVGLWFWTFLILTFSIALPKVQSYTPSLWPKPRSIKLGENVVTIQPEHYKVNLKGSPQETHPLLKKMTELAFSHIIPECGVYDYEIGAKKLVIKIDVTSLNMNLTWDIIEHYRLDVLDQDETTLSVFIFAETVYGARHALETFTQLATTTIVQTNNKLKCHISIISAVEIQDGPIFKHRGLLLDTARHFFEPATIERTLDGMAASKMNVFHWHITDSQSFPFVSARVPELSWYGAFSESEIYTKEEIEEIVQLAQIRGIRVVIEVDGPAHVYAGWDWGQEKDGIKVINCHNKVGGQLNPENPKIYKVLRLLYSDIVEYLPKPILFHMGGDEVDINCWENNEKLAIYMKKNGTSRKKGFFDMWAEFHNKALGVWDEAYIEAGGEKQPVMLWSSKLTDPRYINEYLDPKRFIIELWDREDDAQELLGMGYRLVIASEIWYLDHGFRGGSRYKSWDKIYAHRLPLHPHMMGGEVPMWTEFVDESTVDSRIWPRAAAFAERMWADPEFYNFEEIEARLWQHRARLMARGLHPDALHPQYRTG